MVTDPEPDEIEAAQKRHPSTYTRPEPTPIWLILCDELLLERAAEPDTG